MPKKIKIAVADDHTLFRSCFCEIIGQLPKYNVIIQASDGKELLAMLKAQQPDIVLMDLNMPSLDGLKATSQIFKRYPKIKVLVLSAYAEKTIIIDAIKRGASGYLLKSTDFDEVKQAIEETMRNGFYLNALMNEAMFKGWRNKYRAKTDQVGGIKLTKREKDILKLICDRQSSNEIADTLHLSPRTIDNYRLRIIEKTNSKNIAGLVLYSIDHGLVQPRFTQTWL